MKVKCKFCDKIIDTDFEGYKEIKVMGFTIYCCDFCYRYVKEHEDKNVLSIWKDFKKMKKL